MVWFRDEVQRCYICKAVLPNDRWRHVCTHRLCRAVYRFWQLRRSHWPAYMKGSPFFTSYLMAYFVDRMAYSRTQLDKQFAKRYANARESA